MIYETVGNTIHTKVNRILATLLLSDAGCKHDTSLRSFSKIDVTCSDAEC